MSETNSEETAVIEKVAERLGFFFSNANLRMDPFLRNEIMKEDNDGGFVTIDVLLRFNTIKDITEDSKIIAKAAKEVKRPELKLNNDESAIARVEPFTNDMMEDGVKVTLRVSNIPTKDTDSGPEYDVTREEIADLFKEFGDVAMVRLLKSKLREFRNKVAVNRAFVEYHSEEDMKKAVAQLCTEDINNKDLKPEKVLTVKGTELRVKTMQQWLDKKKAQRDGRSPRANNKRDHGKCNNKDSKRAQAQAEEEEMKAKIEAIEFKLDWKPGCVISMKGLPDSCDREMILTAVKGFLGDDDVTVRADYSRGQKDGAVRFDEPNEKITSLALELKEGKVTIGDGKVESASVLDGDEEKKYYDDYIAFRTKQMRMHAEEKLKRKRRKMRQ